MIPVRTRQTTITPQRMETSDQKYEIWRRNLRIGVREHIIPHIEPGEDEIGKKRAAMLIDEQRMKIWEQAFTDSAVSGASYEPIETYGDGIIPAFIIKTALAMFPGIQPDQLTALVAYYASNKLQGWLMEEKFIITRKVKGRPDRRESFVSAYLLKPDPGTGLVITPAIYADIYEALMGAICLAGDDITNGLGMLYAQRWFNFIFLRNVTMERIHMYGEPSNIAKNLFNRFDFYHVTDDTGKAHAPGRILFPHKNMHDKATTRSWVEVTAIFSPSLITFLRGLDDKLFPQKYKNKLPQVGEAFITAKSETKEEAREEAAALTLEKLDKDFGINEAWISKVKTELDLQTIAKDPALKADYTKVQNFMQANGYKNMRFKQLNKHSKEGNKVGMQLVADDVETGYMEVLFSKLYEKGSTYEVRKDVIRDFVKEYNL